MTARRASTRTKMTDKMQRNGPELHFTEERDRLGRQITNGPKLVFEEDPPSPDAETKDPGKACGKARVHQEIKAAAPNNSLDPRAPDTEFGRIRILPPSAKDELRIICIGDLHYRKENLSEAAVYNKRVLDHCAAIKPDIIVLLGDVLHLHGKDGSLVANFAWTFLKELRVYAHVVTLMGNHDMSDGCQFLTDRHLFNPCKLWSRITIVDKVRHLSVKGRKLVFCPYVPDGRFVEALETMDNWEYIMQADCIFAHQSFYGCKYSETRTCETGDRWNKDYPLVISGHIHTPHRLGENIVYVGSAMQHHHGDFPTNSIALLRWTEGNLSLNRLEIPLKQRVTLVRKLQSMEDIEALKAQLASNKHHDVRLCVSGSKSIINECKLLEETHGIRVDGREQVLKETSTKVFSSDLKTNLEKLIEQQESPSLSAMYGEIRQLLP